MKGKLLTSFVLTSLWAFGEPLFLTATTLDQQSNITLSEANDQTLFAQRGRRGGGERNLSSNRSFGGSRGNLQRERSNSNRVNRSSNIDRNQARQRAQNIDRNQARQRLQNVDQNQARQRLQNVDQNQARQRLQNSDIENRLQNANINRDDLRNRYDNRNFNIDNDRNFSNRINRRDNIGNNINIGSNNNVIINPRGSNNYWGWGWNRGVAWYPTTGCWGGCFWGSFAAGAVTGLVTGAAINSLSNNNQPQYIIVQQNTPGSRLLGDYGLTQTQCRDNVVILFGPQDSKICALPNSTVPAGMYFIDVENFTLVPL